MRTHRRSEKVPMQSWKKSLYLLLKIAELILKIRRNLLLCQKACDWHTLPWAFLNARRRKHSPVGLAVIPSSSLTGSVSLCSGILSPCLLKPKNNPHSTAQSCNNWKANLSLVCSAHCRWLVLNELGRFLRIVLGKLLLNRSDDFYSLLCISTESIKV